MDGWTSHIPESPSPIDRPRVRDLLSTRLRHTRVLLVTAGAGSGKTTAVAEWCKRRAFGERIAWVSVTRDASPAHFWWQTRHALLSAVVSPSTVGGDLANSAGQPPVTRAGKAELDRLRRTITMIGAPTILVVDDLHYLRDVGVLEQLRDLIEHAPPDLQVVLVSRSDPAMRLHRLRIRGELAEVRARDLAFDTGEVTRLFAEYDVTLSDPQVRALLDRTDGWAVGLRLAAMSLEPDAVDQGITRFTGDERTVMEYLTGEVLSHVPEPVRRFLLRTSVAERLTVSLAESLGGGTADALLARLAREDELMIRATRDGREYAYHPLLREMLYHQLSLEDGALRDQQHGRAAAWYAAGGDVAEATRHALLSRDPEVSVRVLLTMTIPEILAGQGDTAMTALRETAGRGGDPLVDALHAAARHAYERDAASLSADVDETGRHLAGLPTDVAEAGQTALSLLGMTSSVLRTGGAGDLDEVRNVVRRLREGALALSPAAARYQPVAETHLGVELMWTGQTAESEWHLRAAADNAEHQRLEGLRTQCLSHLAVLDARNGALASARHRAESALREVGDTATAHLALAQVSLQQADFDQAARHVVLGLAADESMMDRRAHLAVRLTAAELLLAHDAPAKAAATVAQVRAEAEETQAGTPLLRHWIDLVEADARLAGADYATVAEQLRDRVGDGDLLPAELIRLAQAELGLGRTKQAEQLLQPILAEEPTSVAAVEAWLVQAAVQDRRHDEAAAEDARRHAMDLAAPERLRLPFLRTPGKSRRIELAVDAGAAAPALLEALTERELTVLRYLPTMRGNTEIGECMFVSVNTVKSHLKAVYRKLAVSNRREAVNRARELHLL
ncbi:LuxR C-terminal-related transcriptional regulator [Hamadaea sp. NPDC051192]|uniref:LuxR C-terminal-related transcriptional regulator n=1 Tax=Hamadaea sp. NPDC051192 TaxID=3154940 RepID=UPI00342DDD9E